MGILETLGLTRKSEKAPPPPSVDQRKMVLVAALIEEEQKLRAAAIPLGIAQGTARNAIDAQTQAGQYDVAQTLLNTFRTQVADAIRDKPTWTGKAGDVAATDTKISDLEGWADPQAAALKQRSVAIKERATAWQFVQAAADQDTLTQDVALRHQKWTLCRTHNGQMQTWQPRILAADGVPGANKPGHGLAAEHLAYAQAKAACPVTVTDVAQADGLAALALTLDNAMKALMAKQALTKQTLDGRQKDIAATVTLIKQMEKWADPRGAGHANSINAIRQAEASGDYFEADAKYTILKPLVPPQHEQAKLLREHTVAMAMLKKRMDVADQCPGENDGSHALNPLWVTYKAAKTNAPLVVTDPAKAAGLTAFRATLSTATEALIDARTKAGGANDAWYQANFQSLQRTSSALLQKAGYVQPVTEQQIDLKKTFEAIKVSDSTWQKMIGNQERKIAAAKELLAAAGPASSKAEKLFFSTFPKLEPWMEAAKKTEAPDDPLKTTKQTFMDAYAEFTKKFLKVPPDFQGLNDTLADLKTTADAVMKPKQDAVRSKINDLSSMAAGSTSQKNAKSDATANAILDDSVMDPLILKSLEPTEMIALLDALRAAGLQPSSKGNKSNNKRSAQRKVYAAMDLDEKFVKAEKQQRKQIIADLTADAEELKAARNRWTALTADERKAILEKMMNAQCKALGCKAPANGIVILELSGNDNGHYDPNDDIIRINTKMPVYDDFELCSDLIFHENSHNYQFQLSKRLDLPPSATNPSKLTKDNTDPPFTQALMFKANGAANSYVIPDEEYESYKKQPMEDHSWSAGPDTSRRLQKALS